MNARRDVAGDVGLLGLREEPRHLETSGETT
jgi:hypothetical protein